MDNVGRITQIKFTKIQKSFVIKDGKVVIILINRWTSLTLYD